MKPNEVLAERLSRVIFSRSWGKLGLEEQFFIFKHTRWYKYYREKIAAAAREAMNIKKLDGKDYDIIFDWYTQRVDIVDILGAIKECSEWARSNYRGINSLNFFRKSVVRHKEHSMWMSPPREYVEGEDVENWYYLGFNRWKGGKWSGWRYHPFIGPNPYEGVLLEK